MSKRYTPTSAAADVETALRLLEGRWKLVILFHLFGGKVLRFSDLERAIPKITQKMSRATVEKHGGGRYRAAHRIPTDSSEG